jgi:hypothetical protein
VKEAFQRLEGAVAIALLAALLGCAAMDSRPPQEIVRERAQQRWEALITADYAAAYEYLSSGSQTITEKKNYVAMFRKGFWISAVVDKVQCPNSETCEADLTIEYELKGRRMKTPVKEKWIREGWNWRYVQV